MLSGYVLSWKFIEQGDHAYLRASALKRFPRLVAPVFASVLFAWALLTLGVMRTTEAAAIGAASFLSEAYNQPVSLMSALWIGAIGAPLLGQTTINVPLWTIKIELLGSFLLFAVYAMSGSKSPLLALAAFLILLIGFIPGSANIIFFSGFIAGSLLHYIKPPIGGRIWISLALIIAGLIAGGFDYSPLYYWLDDIKLPDSPSHYRYSRISNESLLYGRRHLSGGRLRQHASARTRALSSTLCPSRSAIIFNVSDSLADHLLIIA